MPFFPHSIFAGKKPGGTVLSCLLVLLFSIATAGASFGPPAPAGQACFSALQQPALQPLAGPESSPHEEAAISAAAFPAPAGEPACGAPCCPAQRKQAASVRPHHRLRQPALNSPTASTPRRGVALFLFRYTPF